LTSFINLTCSVVDNRSRSWRRGEEPKRGADGGATREKHEGVATAAGRSRGEERRKSTERRRVRRTTSKSRQWGDWRQGWQGGELVRVVNVEVARVGEEARRRRQWVGAATGRGDEEEEG